jgi:nucleoside-diphosphate-sugar epimerase
MKNAQFDFKSFKDDMYMYSKHMEIKLCSEFSKKGLNVCVVSPTTIYGEGDFGMHVGTLVKKIKSEEILFAPPGGNAVVSVKDAIEGHILAMKKGKSGENYILANEFLTYLDLFNIIAKVLRVKKIEKVLPFWMLPPMKFFSLIVENIFGTKSPVTSASTDFKFRFRYFDSSKARRDLGWKPQQFFENAMRESIQFYRKYKLI